MAKPKSKAATKPKASPRKVGEISPAPYNPRLITPEQLETLGETMKEYGDISGVVVNLRTGNLVGGHQRLKQLDPDWEIEKRPEQDKTGTVTTGSIVTPWGKFSYREVDWPVAKEKAANLCANSSGGEFNYDAVGEILRDLQKEEFKLDLTGFSEKEIQSILQEGGDKGPANTITLEHKCEVVVECKDEQEQQEVYDKLTGEGRQCRLLTI